jgi:hypothetical protein
MADLDLIRGELQRTIINLDPVDGEARGYPLALAYIKANWNGATRLIEDWWDAYKEWEGNDTFNNAVTESRMTIRSFGDGFDKSMFKDAFSAQKSKTVPMNIAEETRFFSNSNRTPVTNPGTHQTAFNTLVAGPKAPFGGWRKGKEPILPYAALNRGIDNSAFATPANFMSREQKYKLGLHDLSVKLLIPNQNIKENSHHKGAKEPHFCFLPISKPEDQYVIYTLIRYAKALKVEKPDLDTLIRRYRSEMTRVKLAHDYDMGTGLVAVHTPGRGDNLDYKVTYSLGDKTKKREEEGVKKIGTAQSKVPMIDVTPEVLSVRKQAYFRENARVIRSGNEFVIAMRKHHNPLFPVYAVYKAGTFERYTIGDTGKMEPTTGRITATGTANF